MAQDSNYVTVDGEFDSLKKRSFLTIDDYELSGKNVILRIDINSSINPEKIEEGINLLASNIKKLAA